MLGAQQLKTETANEPAVVSSKNHNDYLPQIGLLVAVCAITIICYSPILFNFFAGDDYVHLTWLHRVIKDLSTKVISDPELIWRNFHSSWLDGTTTKFYRPLISVFMVSDYELWGLNGLGFHITNLLFHLASTIFIFFTAKNLEEIAGDKTET
ncbi:MAG: hypothetical protein K2X81_15920, partial [Candidatus Obscuribacterales bacterium]|nr:hypothetical protein [Candidatus Obscuribacterales bacterium]